MAPPVDMISFRAGTGGAFILKSIGLFSLYVVVAKLGLMLDAVHGFATLVWAPSGLSLAALMLFGYSLAPAVFCAAWAVNVWVGAPPAIALGIALGNCLEAVVGTYAMRRFADFHGSFDRLRHALGLIFLAATLSTLVSATFGVTSLRLGGLVPAAHYWETLRAWWIGDALGELVVAPLLLVFLVRPNIRFDRKKAVEGGVLAIAMAYFCVSVFLSHPRRESVLIGSPYLLFPLFIWAALRFELQGATLATATASGFAICATIHHSGPFARQTLVGGLLELQIFMGCAVMTPLVVAGAIADRNRAIRSRETFIASVSHDLKNPLNAIRLSAEMLVRSLRPDEPAGRAREHSDLVRRMVDRMTRLIGDLLDASAIDAGRISLEPRAEVASTLLNEAADFLRPLADAKSQTLRIEALEELQVLGDRARVLQVLSNLVGNAIKFSKENSQIMLRLERTGHCARFSVQDRGIGIAPSELPHIFDRYWHGNAKTGGGTGLGLFLARGIVEAHGGSLWCDSQPEVGSTFYFTLPLGPMSVLPR